MKYTGSVHIVRGLALLALALPVSSSIAQDAALAVESRPSSNEVRKWLDSGDPRQIAWAAHFAKKQADRIAVEALLKLVEHWTAPEANQRDQADQIAAMSEVLDTLIQRRERVPAVCISAIASAFPVQAVILASRLSHSDSSRLLLDWYDGRSDQKRTLLPRISAMMLAKAPPDGFAASVLAESEARLEVSVQPPPSNSSFGLGLGFGSFGGSCGDSIGLSKPGWPPLSVYIIEENSPRTRNPTVVKAGGDRITYRRVRESGMRGSCFFPHPLNADTRLGLIAEMLGASKKKLPWKADQSTLMFFEGTEAFQQELRQLVAAEESRLTATSQALYRRGSLTRAEVEAIRPKLLVLVFDDRKSAGALLPLLIPEDPRTSISLSKR
jgi:hypothetical protein